MAIIGSVFVLLAAIWELGRERTGVGAAYVVLGWALIAAAMP